MLHIIGKDLDIKSESNSIKLEDTAENGDLEIHKIYGNTKQETREGYNLINIDKITETSITKNGLTFKNKGNGKFEITGTASASTDFSYTINDISGIDFSKKIYTMSTNKTGFSIQIALYNNSNWVVTPIGRSANWSDLKVSSNIYSGGNPYNNILIEFRFPKDYSADLKDAYVMLYEGTEAKPYEPYGAMPSLEYPSEVNGVDNEAIIEVSNKNLFKPTLTNNGSDIVKVNCTMTLENDKFSFIATGSDMYFGQVVDTGRSYNNGAGIKIDVKGKTKIYYMITNSSFNNQFITAFDKNNKSLGVIRKETASGSYDVPEGASFISFRFGIAPATVGTNYKTKVMVSYEPITEYIKHEGQEYPLDFGDLILYRDNYIYIENDKVYYYKKWNKYTFTGNELLLIENKTRMRILTSQNPLLTAPKMFNNVDRIYEVYSNITVKNSANGTWVGQRGIAYARPTSPGFYIKLEGLTTEAEYREAIKGNYVVYQLEEPETIEITGELAQQIKNLQKLKTYYGGTHIYTITEGLNPILKLKYKAGYYARIQALEEEIKTIEELLSTANTSAMLLDNLQTDLENEVK